MQTFKKIQKKPISSATSVFKTIACKECKRSFDKENHNGYCPYCGANNN